MLISNVAHPGVTTPVSLAAGLVDRCRAAACFPVAVGRYWVKLAVVPCASGEHCAADYVFQNIRTTQLVNGFEQPNGTMSADLSAPRLRRKLCSPLRIPIGFDPVLGQVPGTINVFGRYALATAGGGGAPEQVYLDRCGSTRRQLLESGDQVAQASANARAVAWATAKQIAVRSLSSGTQVALKFPRFLDSVATLGLGGTRLYVVAQNGGVWHADLAMPLRAQG